MAAEISLFVERERAGGSQYLVLLLGLLAEAAEPLQLLGPPILASGQEMVQQQLQEKPEVVLGEQLPARQL